MKKHHVFEFHTIWGKERVKEGSGSDVVVLSLKTHWSGLAEVCVRSGDL